METSDCMSSELTNQTDTAAEIITTPAGLALPVPIPSLLLSLFDL